MQQNSINGFLERIFLKNPWNEITIHFASAVLQQPFCGNK